MTIPKSVRQALGVKSGDLISFVVQKDVVSLKAVRSLGEAVDDSLAGTLAEWDSIQDDEVFRDL